jgi:cytochrome P450
MNIRQKYDIYSQKFKSNPYQVYAEMRRENPIFCQPGLDGETMIWFVTRYDDVSAILSDDKRFVRDMRNALTAEEQAGLPPQPPIAEMINNHMLNRDAEDHRRLRGFVSKAFAPGMNGDKRKGAQRAAPVQK